MWKLFFIIMAVLVLFTLNPGLPFAYEKEIKALSSTMAENISKVGMKKIAVVDFVDLQENITELGRFIAEEFSVALAGSRKGFRVVDRAHLKAILKEHKLAITGLIDPTTAKKLGQISGADALVTGTITPFGDSVRLAVKVLDTATGDVIDASSADIAKTKAIEDLLGRGIESTAQTGREVGKGYTPKPSPPGPSTITKKELPYFDNGWIRVAAESLKKKGNIARLHFRYQIVGDENERFSLHYNNPPYLLDENGGMWVIDRDRKSEIKGIKLTNFDKPDEFYPGVERMVELSFIAKGNPNANIFTLIIPEHWTGNPYNPDHISGRQTRNFKVVIKNIRAE